jgi:hypothetical protein
VLLALLLLLLLVALPLLLLVALPAISTAVGVHHLLTVLLPLPDIRLLLA